MPGHRRRQHRCAGQPRRRAPRVLEAVGTRFYVRVVGPLRPKLSIKTLSIDLRRGPTTPLGGPVGADVTYTVVNTGNVRLTPRATLRLSRLIGSAPAVIPGCEDCPPTPLSLQLEELLPGGSQTVKVRFAAVPPFLRLQADLTVTSEAPTVTKTTTKWVLPWLLLLLLVLIGLGTWLWRRYRRGRAAAEAPPADEAAEGEGPLSPVPAGDRS